MERLTVKGVDRIAPAIPALPAGDARQEAFERALGTLVGKSMPVTVLARLTDGSFLVRVADQNARMALPAGTQPGTDVPMTLVSAHPRPAFQLTGGAGQLVHPTLVNQEFGELRAPGAAAVAAFRAQLAPGADSAGAEARNAHVSLSDAGRAIARILGAGQAPAGHAASISSPTPLSGSGTPEPARLAQALAGALARSGLFYESHVAEWAEGKRALPELLREPQMQKAMADGLSKDIGVEADAAAAQLISQQLAAHENGRLVWQGQVWPGQHLEWQIDKEAPREQAQDEAAEPAWQSRLKLRFPLLGELAASVALSGGLLHIRVDSADDSAAALLRAHADRLTAALEAAGTPLASLAIGTADVRDA
jgi:hypothetical protein